MAVGRAKKRKVVKKKTVARRKVSKAKPKSKPRPRYTCVLCGVEVAVSRDGLGIWKLMCCGQPMRKK